MSKIKVVFEFNTPQEAAAFLSASSGAAQNSAGAGAPSTAPAPTSAAATSPSSPPGMTMGNPPPGTPPSPPAPAASPTPPAAPPAPPASAPPGAPPMAPAAPPTPSGGLQGEVLQLMQNWGKQGHKAAGIKRVLNKINVSGVGAATPEQLAWLKWAFSPQADGSYNTPEYIESLT